VSRVQCVRPSDRHRSDLLPTLLSQNRIYVQSGVYEKFAAMVADKVSTFSTGDPMLPGTQIGPLVNSRGVDKVQRHVEDAVSKGAKVLTGGRKGDGCLFEPTVLSNVPADAAISTEETFGPLAALFSFETEDEVISSANDSEVGLAGYVFTRDISRVHRVSEKLAVGMVAVNTGIISQPCVPFGGVKGSGFGREGGKGGIDEYTIEKVGLRVDS
jgi:succinate-semialdehyde dehydrogenase/glutarate-semialdehyde dehydrogenase